MSLETCIKANEESLTRQSRSFAIPTLNLDSRFRNPVMVEYNLNKTIDTIEDALGLEADEKIYLIRTFCDYLHRDEYSEEVQKRMLEVTPQDEAFVFKNYDSTIALFNTLSEGERAISKKWTTEMADGMCAFLTRSIDTLKDLNEYCYYVAGTVGMYLTNLVRLKGSNITDGAFENLEQNAVSFGLFLQKLNIIRDYVEDKAEKKRSFWPQSYFEEEPDGVKILNQMCYETLKNDAPRAIEYFKHIPPGNDSYDRFIRFILRSGLEYLRILKNNKSVFSKIKVKLPKIFIKTLYDKVGSQPRAEFAKYCDRFYAEEMAQYAELL